KSYSYFSAGQDARLWLHHCKHANKTLCPCNAVILTKLVQLTVKVGNPGVVGFYKTFMQTLHQTLGWRYPVWAVIHAGHCMEHKLVFLREHVPRGTCLVLVGHSVGCYIILEMMTWDPELQVVKSVMLFPTIERMAVTPQGRLLTPLLLFSSIYDHSYPVQSHQEIKRDFPNGDIRLCSRGIRHALVLDTGKEVADMIVEWIHSDLQT
uniref:Lipid droplet-associated hydrolase n=1 Tax=Hucho hucho TaxID=62062 RepID=A0A4W5PT56_9TELE